jgi:hypothetical protein
MRRHTAGWALTVKLAKTSSSNLMKHTEQGIEIWTEQDRFGMYSYEFVLNGIVHADHDYQSRGNALEAARSAIREALNLEASH